MESTGPAINPMMAGPRNSKLILWGFGGYLHKNLQSRMRTPLNSVSYGFLQLDSCNNTCPCMNFSMFGSTGLGQVQRDCSRVLWFQVFLRGVWTQVVRVWRRPPKP